MNREQQQKSAAYGLHLLKRAVLSTLYEECELGPGYHLNTRQIRVNLGLQNPAINANLVRGILEYLDADRYVEETGTVQGAWRITQKGVKFIEGETHV